MNTRQSWKAAATALLVAGCAAADAGLSSETINIVDPPVTVPVIELDATTLDAAPDLALEEIFRIDGESNPDVKLSDVREVDFSDDSTIVVLESQLSTVLVYDTTGRLVRRFGRRGGGPGEFRGAGVMTVAGDTVFILDMITVHRMTTDGKYVGGFQIDNAVTVAGQGTAMGSTNMLALTPSGLIGYFHVPHGFSRSEVERVGRDTMLLQVINRPSGAVRTIVHVERADHYRSDSFEAPAWFVLDPYVAVAPNGTLFITRPSNTAIEVYDNDGRHLRRISLLPERRRVSDADVDAVLSRSDSISNAMQKKMEAQEGRDEHPGPSAAEFFAKGRRFKRTIPHAELYPVIGRILASDSSDLLVERADLSQGSGEWWGASGPTVWDLMDAGGAIKGRTEFPRGFTPEAMRGRIVVGVQRDVNDVPSVVGYRLQ